MLFFCFFFFVSTITLIENVYGQSYLIKISEEEFVVHMGEDGILNYTVTSDVPLDSNYYLLITSRDSTVAKVDLNVKIPDLGENSFVGNFSIYGEFLGRTDVILKLYKTDSENALAESSVLIVVRRPEAIINTIFTVSVAVLVSLIYINFGSALNWHDFFYKYLKRPVGPAIGLFGQFVFMPLLSYGIGYLLFPNDPAMQLGFYYTGCTPGGGGSNIWAAILDGNIDLSITMTGVSTLAAFGMIPFWIFTLGATIFERSNLSVPYRNIVFFAIGLVIPLGVGYLIQRYLPNMANFFRRTLKIFSGILILFIIIFAIVTNLYLFEIFSWRIVAAGLGVPWLGYVGGFILGKIFRQSNKDSLTIAVEVGLQNTGIAIFMLRFSLPQPEADITTIAPVAVACMTPIPLFCLFLIKLIIKRYRGKNDKSDDGNDEVENNKQIDQKLEKDIAIISLPATTTTKTEDDKITQPA